VDLAWGSSKNTKTKVYTNTNMSCSTFCVVYQKIVGVLFVRSCCVNLILSKIWTKRLSKNSKNFNTSSNYVYHCCGKRELISLTSQNLELWMLPNRMNKI